jgi:hypothetical protein
MSRLSAQCALQGFPGTGSGQRSHANLVSWALPVPPLSCRARYPGGYRPGNRFPSMTLLVQIRSRYRYRHVKPRMPSSATAGPNARATLIDHD